MSLKRRRVIAHLALTAVVLGMVACTQDASEPEQTSMATMSATESTAMEPTLEDSQPGVEASVPTASETASAGVTTGGGPNDESGVVDVTVTGDQGILALQHFGTAPMGAAGPTNQKLIAGPGGCLALTNEGKPRLLVFPADATFVLEEGKPSATIAGTEYLVGSQFAVATTEVTMPSVAGVPDRCMQGADDIVLVVN